MALSSPVQPQYYFWNNNLKVNVRGWQHCASYVWLSSIAIELILFINFGRRSAFSNFITDNYNSFHILNCHDNLLLKYLMSTPAQSLKTEFWAVLRFNMLGWFSIRKNRDWTCLMREICTVFHLHCRILPRLYSNRTTDDIGLRKYFKN